MDSETIRNLMMRSLVGDKATNDEVRDWPREKAQEFLTATQIRNWVREEFVNRWRNIGLNYTTGTDGSVPAGQATNFDSLNSPLGLFAMQNPDELSTWQSQLYKGPKTSWVRFASNAHVMSSNDSSKSFKGFVLQGNGNFHDTYGFDKGDGYNGGGGDAKTLLGYDMSTPPQRHEIFEPDYKHRPTPGITSIESEDVDYESGLRQATVNFTCWSPTQLDYLDQYFFRPGMSASVEWGWNTYPRDALMSLTDAGLESRRKIWRNEPTGEEEDGTPAPGAASVHTRNGQGNYGWVMGIITNFSSTIRDDGGFDCSVDIKSPIDLARFTQFGDADAPKKSLDVPTTYANFVNETLNRLLVANNTADYARINRATQRKGKTLIDEAERRRRIDDVYDGDQFTMTEAGRARRAENQGTRDGILEKKALSLARGRFFTFNAYSSTKPYYAGKANEGGSYITVGFFIDTINLFFSRISGAGLPLSQFSCWNSRAIAHPNIKSTDGNIMLIPNSLAPRWNTETYLGGTVGSRTDQNTEPMAYQLLQKGDSGNERYSNLTSSFISMVNAMNAGGAPATTLEEAMKKSPRDDLHRYLSAGALGGYDIQHPLLEGKMTYENVEMINSGKPTKKLEDAWESPSETIQPFPDFKTIIGAGETAGYSGRIADLFVNLKVIKEAAKLHDNPGDLILDVMKQVSSAAGDIWDFRLVNGDTTTTTPNVLQLVDLNYTGTRPVGELKKKTWVFPAHRGDGIIREMDWSVDLSNESAIQTLFSSSTNEKYSKEKNDSVFADQADDLLFGGKPKNKYLEGSTDQSTIIDSAQKSEAIPDKEKFIVSMSTQGLKPGAIKSFANYETDPELTGTYDFFKPKMLGGATKVTKSKKYWISYPNPRTGKKEVKSADNIHQRQMNVKMATERMGVKPEDIKYAPGSVDNRGKFGSSMAQTGVADFKQAKRRIHKIWVNDGWLKQKRNFTGSYHPLPNGLQGDDNKIKQLIGQEIVFHSTFQYANVDKANPPKNGKKYDIISASVPRNSEGKMTDVNYDGFDTGYVLHIQERKFEGTMLNRSMIQRYQQAKTDGAPIPSDIADLIKKNEISEDDIVTLQNVKYMSSAVNNQNMNVTNRKIKDTTYGAKEDDFELDIEMVDPEIERMLRFCRIDDNAKNNMVNNMPFESMEITLTFDGIFGLRLMDVFECTGVPVKIFVNGIWTIMKINHTIADGDWQTTITGIYTPGKKGFNFEEGKENITWGKTEE